jgi:hypothetical protein
MADTTAIGVAHVGVADIKQDAWQILARTYRLRGQVSLGERKGTRFASALLRGLEDLIGYAESVCGDEDVDEDAGVQLE